MEEVFKVKCRGCEFVGHNYVVSINGRMFKFYFCGRQPHELPVVEPDLPRDCQYWRPERGEGLFDGEREG